MAEKLQLRSTSEPAKRAKRTSLKDRTPTGPSASHQQFPGAKAAQMVRLAMLSKIAKASMESAQQKQQQEARSQTEAQPGSLPQQAKQGPAYQAQQAQQARRDAAQQGGRPPTEVAWESDAPSSSALTQAQQETVTSPNSADFSGSQGLSEAAQDIQRQARPTESHLIISAPLA